MFEEYNFAGVSIANQTVLTLCGQGMEGKEGGKDRGKERGNNMCHPLIYNTLMSSCLSLEVIKEGVASHHVSILVSDTYIYK